MRGINKINFSDLCRGGQVSCGGVDGCGDGEWGIWNEKWGIGTGMGTVMGKGTGMEWEWEWKLAFHHF
jgi:hypothetical protein